MEKKKNNKNKNIRNRERNKTETILYTENIIHILIEISWLNFAK